MPCQAASPSSCPVQVRLDKSYLGKHMCTCITAICAWGSLASHGVAQYQYSLATAVRPGSVPSCQRRLATFGLLSANSALSLPWDATRACQLKSTCTDIMCFILLLINVLAYVTGVHESTSASFGPPRLTYPSPPDPDLAGLIREESESDILPFAIDGDASSPFDVPQLPADSDAGTKAPCLYVNVCRP